MNIITESKLIIKEIALKQLHKGLRILDLMDESSFN